MYRCLCTVKAWPGHKNLIFNNRPMTQASMASAVAVPPQGRTLHGGNVRRLMARFGMTLTDVVAATGLDERTLRSILRGTTQPHAKTLHKLAHGLGVDV